MGRPPAKSPSSSPPPQNHITPHTHSHNFSHSCCLSFSLAALSLSLSLSALHTDTCSIYNSLALKEPFWTGSCPFPTPDGGFFPKRQHPPQLHLLPLRASRRRIAGWRKGGACVCRGGGGGWWHRAGVKITHPTPSAPGLGPCVF